MREAKEEEQLKLDYEREQEEKENMER